MTLINPNYIESTRNPNEASWHGWVDCAEIMPAAI